MVSSANPGSAAASASTASVVTSTVAIRGRRPLLLFRYDSPSVMARQLLLLLLPGVLLPLCGCCRIAPVAPSPPDCSCSFVPVPVERMAHHPRASRSFVVGHPRRATCVFLSPSIYGRRKRRHIWHHKDDHIFCDGKNLGCGCWSRLSGWVQDESGEWQWEEDDPNYVDLVPVAPDQEDGPIDGIEALALEGSRGGAPPRLPSGEFRPKQSLGQNFLKDGNTIGKIVTAFARDATETIRGGIDGVDIEGERPGVRPVELGPGAGALTGPLVDAFGDDLRCIEVDPRSVELLGRSHPDLRVDHMDVLQVDYGAMAEEEGGPLSVVGNLPYYITSQILFALADASHGGAVRSATVTMQWEVAQRIIAPTCCKAYGILSVVFQLYADCTVHFKIPPTVFYPKPKVDSALVGLRFVGPDKLRQRLAGVQPKDLRRVITAAFQQRRKTLRNSLKKLAIEVCGGDKVAARALLDSPPRPLPEAIARAREEGDDFATSQELPLDWATKRPEQLSPGQMVELTRLICGDSCYADSGTKNQEDSATAPLGRKVWRKVKHGANGT